MPQDRTDQGNSRPFTSNWRLIEPSLAVGLVSRRITFTFSLIALACVFLSACSNGAGGNGLEIKSAATDEKDLALKSAYPVAVTKSFTDVIGKITTAPSYRIYPANYDLHPAY